MVKKGVCGCIYSPDLTEADTIGKPPRLIRINRGGYVIVPASVKD